MEHYGTNTDASLVTMEGKGQRVFVCVFICVYVCGEHGDREEVGGCSPAPKRFVSAKRFPCPSQMAGHAPTLAVEKEEQKEHRGRRHTCLCVQQINSCCDLCIDWIRCIQNVIYTPSQTKKKENIIKYMWDLGREVTEASRIPRLFWKNDQF